MKLIEVIETILKESGEPLTPQEIRDIIKVRFPEHYNTESAQRNIAKGYYSGPDGALLAAVYNVAKKFDQFSQDKSTKPMRIYLTPSELGEQELIESEAEDYEKELGLLYILSTGVYTSQGKKIVKIGITTGDLQTRIKQLYTTGAPFKFEEVKSYKVKNYLELETALHKLLDPYRLSIAREFFDEGCLDYVERIIDIHNQIQDVGK